MRLTDGEIHAIFERRQAYLTGLHVVYTSGKHGEEYINKDAVLPHVADTSRLCQELAHRVMHLDPDVIVGPVAGAVALAHSLAHHLSLLLGREILAVYADRLTEEALLREERDGLLKFVEFLSRHWHVGDADRLTAISQLESYADKVRQRPKHQDTFVLKRGYDQLVAGKRALPVEDIVNTGGSMDATVSAIAHAGGIVVGKCGLVNRGDSQGIITLLQTTMAAWEEREMPDWLRERPITTHVGKGKEYLAKRAASPHET